jgi:O-antigen/teichoic acid export membrane protein
MNFLARQLARFRRFDKNGSVSGTILVNFGAAGLSALSSIVFARILRIADFGLYVYAVSAIGLVGSLAALGLPTLITRETAAFAATADWKKFNGMLRFGMLAPLVSSLLFGVVLLLCGPFLGKISETPGFFVALELSAGIMVVQCVDLTIAGLLQGMHAVARSLIPQGIVGSAMRFLFWETGYFLSSIRRPIRSCWVSSWEAPALGSTRLEPGRRNWLS